MTTPAPLVRECAGCPWPIEDDETFVHTLSQDWHWGCADEETHQLVGSR